MKNYQTPEQESFAYYLPELLKAFGYLIIIGSIIWLAFWPKNTEELEGCRNPHVALVNGLLLVEYVYDCDNGRQVVSPIKPQDLPEHLFDRKP